MELLKLFWSFVKIGFTSFGGLSMIPLISGEMQSHGWMTVEEVSDIVGIAEMTPGPFGLNCATFAGLRTAGIPGAIASNLGVLTPTLTVCAIFAIFFEKSKENKFMKHALIGIRPACIGLIGGTVLSLLQTNYVVGSAVSLYAIAIGLLDVLLLFRWKWSIPKVIILSAVLGIVCFGIL